MKVQLLFVLVVGEQVQHLEHEKFAFFEGEDSRAENS